MTDRLPPISRAYLSDVIACPWCREDCDGAVVSLGDLLQAHAADHLDYPRRNRDDTADEDSLSGTCPHCARPFMVGLRKETSQLVLVPVRTAKDAAFRGGGK